MTGGGKGVEPGDHKLSHSGSCVETGGEAGKHRGVEGVLNLELLVDFGDEVDRVRLSLLPLGRRGCQPFRSFEGGFGFQGTEPPLQAMQDVPGTYAVDIVGDSGPGVGTSQAGDERGDGGLVSWGSQLLRDAPHVAEYVINEEAGTVGLARRFRPSVRHDIEDPLIKY
jgi:hypothetical protein